MDAAEFISFRFLNTQSSKQMLHSIASRELVTGVCGWSIVRHGSCTFRSGSCVCVVGWCVRSKWMSRDYINLRLSIALISCAEIQKRLLTAPCNLFMCFSQVPTKITELHHCNKSNNCVLDVNDNIIRKSKLMIYLA